MILKRINLTNKYVFSIHYNSNNEGYLIFGAYPHEYFPNKYKEKQLISFYTTPDKFEITNFIINIDEVISSNNNIEKKISNNTNLVFELYYGFFVGNGAYQDYIEKYFFNDLIEKKKFVIDKIRLHMVILCFLTYIVVMGMKRL